jgi:hypothetical protein
MANKMTKKDYFNILKATYPTTAENYDEVINFINHEIEMLESKSKSGKASKEVEANNLLRDEIYENMKEGKSYTITEMLTTFPCCAGMQNQRVTALVRGMIPNRVERIEEKGRAYFRKI